ncbi:hypothetical protein FDUTEX481_09359 [Tolypothrix sp. PCC 7601]|nr:hypothetical protein FDUTEX481_09359 [Tolypothrix sp. PCC 7601]
MLVFSSLSDSLKTCSPYKMGKLLSFTTTAIAQTPVPSGV